MAKKTKIAKQRVVDKQGRDVMPGLRKQVYAAFEARIQRVEEVAAKAKKKDKEALLYPAGVYRDQLSLAKNKRTVASRRLLRATPM
jgi:hypothetical protein